MERYIDRVFLKYSHTKPMYPQLTQHKHREIKYGSTQEISPAEDTIPALDAADV